MKNFKYKTSFSSKIRCLIDEDKDRFLAKASLENLKSIIPDNVKSQVDLLAIAFNSCTPNVGNRNGDMIDSKTALDIYQGFINRPINVEHGRGNGAIGHIVSAAFSEFNTDYALGSGSKIIEASEIKDKKFPFNIALSAVLYRLYGTELIDEIENSANPNSTNYLAYATSWELAFDEFVLAVGSQYLEDCEIIEDEAQILGLLKYTIEAGGSGRTPEGKPIYRLIKGEVYPLGIGITESPAALVAGITTDSEKSKIEVKSNNNESKTDITLNTSFKLVEKEEEADIVLNVYTKNNEISISQSNNTDVNLNNDNKLPMKITKISDLTDATLKEVKASEITEFYDAEIKKISDDWEAKKSRVDVDLKAANDKSADLESKYNKATETLTKVQEDLGKLVKAAQDKEAEDKFSARMTYFDGEFDLDEKERSVVGNQIKNLSDEDYTTVKENLETLLAAKKKSGKVFNPETKKWEIPTEKKEVKASVETKEDKKEDDKTVIDNALDNATKTNQTVAATTTVTETLDDKFKRAFGVDNWEPNRKKK